MAKAPRPGTTNKRGTGADYQLTITDPDTNQVWTLSSDDFGPRAAAKVRAATGGVLSAHITNDDHVDADSVCIYIWIAEGYEGPLDAVFDRFPTYQEISRLVVEVAAEPDDNFAELEDLAADGAGPKESGAS